MGILRDLFGPGTWGTGGNLVAWVICGALAFGWLRAKLKAQHIATLAQAARHHKEQLAQDAAQAERQHAQAERQHAQALDLAAGRHDAQLDMAAAQHQILMAQSARQHQEMLAHVTAATAAPTVEMPAPAPGESVTVTVQGAAEERMAGLTVRGKRAARATAAPKGKM